MVIIDSFFFLMGILVNFRTASFDEERILIYDPHALFWKYAKGWFLLDLISTVPIDELFQAVVGTSNQTLRLFPTKLLRLFRIARLLKLTRLIKLSRVFGRIRDTVQLSPSTERFFKLLAIMSIFLHTCMFHANDQVDQPKRIAPVAQVSMLFVTGLVVFFVTASLPPGLATLSSELVPFNRGFTLMFDMPREFATVLS
ncbi:hypothetical protein V7S43_016837 [Phytophthora oleae]|uniref:Ion transport domain-containing protein n=1 Tax=Phytophthora oleae TaxID=2107226 RepID=A0ABD3EWX9_9STRA